MSSIKEQFCYKSQEITESNNFNSLHPLKSISKKPNIFELMECSKLEIKNKNKSNLKFCGIFIAFASSIVLFYSLY